MSKTQEATAQAQVHTIPDEVTSSNSKYDAINILENIHKQAVQDMLNKWKMENLIELLQKTFNFIAGVNNDDEMSEYDLMYEWTDFSHFYSAAYYTRTNHISVECAKEELEDVSGTEKE